MILCLFFRNWELSEVTTSESSCTDQTHILLITCRELQCFDPNVNICDSYIYGGESASHCHRHSLTCFCYLLYPILFFSIYPAIFYTDIAQLTCR